MFWHAGLMVKSVMLLLLFFSLGSWYIIFKKHMLFKKIVVDTGAFAKSFWSSKSLVEAHKALSDKSNSPEAAIFRAGYNELQKIKASRPGSSTDASLEMRLAGIDNLKRSLSKAETSELNRVSRNLAFLATTGSATPFIGLFGTVWGIMTSFHEIGKIGSASLAVVAPGISEALVATAAGLAVAIPAVIFYNYYSNKVAELEGQMQSFSADFLNLVERDLIARN
ncbi:MAG: protein TolQ [Proteobacteria bacterium]|nr:protein TolQ [Pseudomonadota bacterium]MBU1739637.1 protein TolQ [Pseudomonadota bacterium]